MVRDLMLVATATAMFFSLLGPTMCHGFAVQERLDGHLSTSVPYHGPSGAVFHVRLAISPPPGQRPCDVGTDAVSGTFRCKGDTDTCLRRTGTLSNIVLRARTNACLPGPPNPRDYGLVDFDADLSFAGMPESCHIAATGPFLGLFLSLTGGYTCTTATGAVFDTGIVILQRKCR